MGEQDTQMIEAFVGWLIQTKDEYKDKTPEQAVELLNEYSSTEEGQKIVQEDLRMFQSEMQNKQMLRKGGKIDQLLKLHK